MPLQSIWKIDRNTDISMSPRTNTPLVMKPINNAFQVLSPVSKNI
jgi:hypothetical protein